MAPFVFLTAVAWASAESGQDPEGPYQADFGLTGFLSNENASARAALEPLLKQLQEARQEFLFGDRKSNGAILAEIADLSGRVMDKLGPNLEDDSILLRGIAMASSSVNVLRLFQRHAAADSLASRLRSLYSQLRSDNPWNPVLAAYAEGAALRQSLAQ